MKFGKGTHTYELVENWAKVPEHVSLKDVCSVVIDEADNSYLVSRGSHPLLTFDREGNFLSAWDKGEFVFPHGACLGSDDSIFFIDASGHSVTKYTKDGKPLLQIGPKGEPSDTGVDFWTPEADVDFEFNLESIVRGAEPFNQPTNAFVDSSGDIFVSDGYGNARVHRFTSEGKLIASWGEPGRKPGQFRVPHFVWVDKHDRIWVADRQNHRLQIFDINGKYLDEWAGFEWPCAIYIDEEETVYVAELKRRISILDKNGRAIAMFRCEEPDKDRAVLLAPHGIALDSRGDLYVSEVAFGLFGIDKKNRAIQKFARV